MRDFRRLWTVRTNAATREYDLPYGQFVTGLKRANIDLNRRIVATLAETEPVTFKALVDESKAYWKVPVVRKRQIHDL